MSTSRVRRSPSASDEDGEGGRMSKERGSIGTFSSELGVDGELDEESTLR